jgi:hypothetical protein
MESNETETASVVEMPDKPKIGGYMEPLDADWAEIRRACEAGLSLIDAAKVFQISYEALRKRAQRETWLHPAKVEELKNQKKQEMLELRAKAIASQVRPEGVIAPLNASQALTETFEGHRSGTLLKLAKLASNGLERAVSANLEIENWQDAKIVADIAMKLHNVGQDSVQVNVLVGGDGGFDGPAIEIEGVDSAFDGDDDMDE